MRTALYPGHIRPTPFHSSPPSSHLQPRAPSLPKVWRHWVCGIPGEGTRATSLGARMEQAKMPHACAAGGLGGRKSGQGGRTQGEVCTGLAPFLLNSSPARTARHHHSQGIPAARALFCAGMQLTPPVSSGLAQTPPLSTGLRCGFD